MNTILEEFNLLIFRKNLKYYILKLIKSSKSYDNLLIIHICSQFKENKLL